MGYPVGDSPGARRPAPPPRPAPKPSGGFLGNIGRSIGNVGHAVSQGTHIASTPQTGHLSDAATSGGTYGTAQANAYKQTPAYHHAIVQVFKAQPPAQQKAIVQGALRNPTAEGRLVLNYLQAQRQVNSIGHEAGLGGALGDVARFVNNPFGSKVPLFSTSSSVGGPTAAVSKIAKNAGKDLVNLPAEAVSTVGTLGGDVLSGKPGKAVNDFVSPYVQLAQHPADAFINHPLLTTLMVTGLAHGATRLAAAPVRALAPESAAGRAISTQRPGVALTANLTHERPPFSKSPTIKAQQASIDNSLYAGAPSGELVPKSDWQRKHLLNQGIGQLVGVRERIRRVNQEQVKAARQKAISPQIAVRAGHAAKTALAYGPKPAEIPGAAVLARIADATIRRKDTIAQDLQKHLAQVSANRPNLLGDKQALAAHDAYVKQLQAVARNKAFVRNPGRAFAAAQAFARDYQPVQAAASKLGHFGNMSADLLQRRDLAHYAVTHMGATMHPEHGLVDAAGRPLANSAILAHLKGPEGTGGRLPAYTPDRVRFDRKNSFYVSGERRPLPSTAKNTLYAYTHGLTDPSHLALTEQHALMQGVVDAHHAQNTYADTLHVQMPGGGYAKTYAEAQDRLRGTGMKPINLAQPFHPQGSLSQVLEDVHPAAIEEEALRHSLDLSSRMRPDAGPGRWAGIDPHALKVLQQHQNQISPNPLLRTIRGLNNQFRTVALSTSAKHIPGVAQENLIRDIAQGVGFRSWISGHRMLSRAEQINPEKGREVRTSLTGGQVAGMTQAGKTYMVSDHWAGTSAYPVLKAFEVAAKAPGTRQLNAMWKAWTRFAIQGTKHVLEQQHQIAGLGKAALREHGYADAARTQGFMGLVHRAFGLHGRLLDDASRGLFDPAKARQMRATINQMYGKWTDLSPSAQTALMFSPFGLWWVNSAKFLARMPTDQPVKTSLLASATAGTQQERQAHGLDMFMPGAAPAYEQGGIPSGGKIIAQNYYSPFGIVNDPLATGQSLIQPWATPLALAALPNPVNWLGKPLSSPGNPKGGKPADVTHRLQYILDSALSSFLPLYTKAKQVLEGGSSAYDTTDKGLNPFPPATKQPGKGPATGLKKAVQPFRSYNAVTSGGPATGGWGGGSSTSAPGWGGGGSTSAPGWG